MTSSDILQHHSTSSSSASSSPHTAAARPGGPAGQKTCPSGIGNSIFPMLLFNRNGEDDRGRHHGGNRKDRAGSRAAHEAAGRATKRRAGSQGRRVRTARGGHQPDEAVVSRRVDGRGTAAQLKATLRLVSTCPSPTSTIEPEVAVVPDHAEVVESDKGNLERIASRPAGPGTDGGDPRADRRRRRCLCSVAKAVGADLIVVGNSACTASPGCSAACPTESRTRRPAACRSARSGSADQSQCDAHNARYVKLSGLRPGAGRRRGSSRSASRRSLVLLLRRGLARRPRRRPRARRAGRAALRASGA